jgi:YVTN family beta-propeller protein
MGYARYVGRVGGLALALGVGVAVATTPGVAWAGPDDGSADTSTAGTSTSTTDSTSGTAASTTTGSSGATGGGAVTADGSSGATPAAGGTTTTDSSGAMNVDSSGGSITSTTAGSAGATQGDGAVSNATTSEPTTAAKPKPKAGGKSGSNYSASSAPNTPKRLSVTTETAVGDQTKNGSSTQRAATVEDSGRQPGGHTEARVPVQLSGAPAALTGGTASDQAAQALASAPAASNSAVSEWKLTVLSAVGLAPSADGDVPEAPGDSPILLAGLAAVRRQTQQSLVGDETSYQKVADPSQSSLMMADATSGESMMMAAAVANSAPTAAPVLGSPDQATGAVRVSLNATDAEGSSLSYSVTGQPAGGTVQVLGAGEYVYTPSTASRLAAAATSTPDFDSFTVSVSDGQGGVTPVTVSVPKLPAVLANQQSSSNVTGASPAGVAVVGDLAYVANQGTNTVTVIDTKTGAVVGNPIVVGSAPTGVLASADGSKVFVTNRTSGTVSVIRTSDNTVVGSVKVGTHPEEMALDNTGTKLYVTNYGSSNVSVVDVSAQTPRLITNIAVGAYPRDIAFAMVNNQPRLYVTRYSSSSVAVIDANTNKQIDVNPSTSTVDSIKVGANPQQITVSPDGTRAYVTNYGSSSVSVINLATNTLDGTAISVGSKPAGMALSADGSLLYVANGNDTVSVINTKTRALVSTLQIDTAPETNYHTIAVRSDGSLVVTDMADKALRVVTLKRGNTAPVAIANPSMGSANPANGAITGSINIKDPDGDPLAYSAAVAPTKGSLTFDPVTGTYTYTPTQAARDAAAQTPATDTFTIRAADSSGASVTTAPITVSISPTSVANRAPQAGTPSIDTRNTATGAVSGSLNFSDPDGNPMTYSVPTQPSSGTVTLVGSRYTFTPYQSARDAAAVSQGPDAVDITVVASDGQLSTPVTFSVPILPPNPPNQAPVHGAPSADTIVNSSGAVSGSLNFTDPDGDPMTYSVPTQPSSGTVTLSGSTYTFTPTAAARTAAAASQGPDLATITVVASDGQASDTVTFTVPIMQSAKTTNQAPWVPGSTIPRTVDPVSGTVTGYVNVQDPNGDTLIYTLASPPTQGGTVTFDQRSGYFSYTPSQAARAQAAQTPGLDYDTFSVNITDGTATVNTTVSVQVAAALPPASPTTNNTASVGSGPSGVVVLSNNNAYVVNYDSNTVSVINTTTNQVVKTIDVGSGPLSVTAVDTTGRQRVYVTNSLSNTVSVIDPATNTVIGTINVPVQEGSVYDGYYDYTFTYPNRVAEVAASSNRLYVNATDGTISVFDTTNDANTLLRTDSLGLYNDLELSADGTRLYGTKGGSLAVINTATMSATNVAIGPVFAPQGSYQEYTSSIGNVALSPDGKRAYVTYGVTIAQRGVGGQPYGSFFSDSTGSNWMVTGGYSAVAVIDTDPTSSTYNTQIARILVPQGAQDLAVSGNNLYVTNSDNMTVTVIDRTTQKIVGRFSTDQSTGGRAPIEIFPDYWNSVGSVPSSARYISVDRNGTVYITDYADGKMYAVTVGSSSL